MDKKISAIADFTSYLLLGSSLAYCSVGMTLSNNLIAGVGVWCGIFYMVIEYLRIRQEAR